MKQKIVCIVQARVGSTRLPGKVLLDLAGKTVLERVIERVKKSALIDSVVVGTTMQPKDLAIVDICARTGTLVYCGSEDDVLDRYFQAARITNAGHIVRVTADCPLIDPAVIDKVIRAHLTYASDYTSNALVETFPDGQDVEVFTFHTIQKAWSAARLRSEREHVTPYIRKNPRRFTLINVANDRDLSCQRWTLDEKADYKFIRSVYRYCGKKKKIFGVQDVMRCLARRPALCNINMHIGRNEGYVKSVKHDCTYAKRG